MAYGVLDLDSDVQCEELPAEGRDSTAIFIADTLSAREIADDCDADLALSQDVVEHIATHLRREFEIALAKFMRPRRALPPDVDFVTEVEIAAIFGKQASRLFSHDYNSPDQKGATRAIESSRPRRRDHPRREGVS